MRSWKIENGDLALGPHGYAEVAGPDRILQDTALSVLEPFGCDRFHPRWGSYLQQMIGQPIAPNTQAVIQSEVIRLVQNYIIVQSDLQTQARNAGKRSPFGANDLIASIEDIQITQYQTQLVVKVVLKTVSGDTVALTNTIPSS